MVAFEIVVVVVCVTSAVIVAVMFARATRLYDKIGALGTLGMSHDDEPAAGTREIVREEVRQMVDAISALRAERGNRPFRRTYCANLRRGPGGAQPAIAAAIGPVLGPSATHLEVLADPARACAGLLIATAASGGELVLAGGRTPGPASALSGTRTGGLASGDGVVRRRAIRVPQRRARQLPDGPRDAARAARSQLMARCAADPCRARDR